MYNQNEKGYLVDRPEESKEYIMAWSITGKYLQKIFNQYNQVENIQKFGFNWLRTKIISPTFDSMNFRYKNQVFSILVDLIDFIDYDIESQTTENAKNLQIEICNKNNLIPCLFKIKTKNMQPATGGWNLFDTRNDKKINPFDLTSDELIPISNWELLNWGNKYCNK